MENLKKHKALIAFTLLYVLAFSLYYVWIKNFEFLWYVAVLLFFIFLIGGTLHKTKLNPISLWGLSVWGFLHMAGGGIKIGSGVLYGLVLFPFVQKGEMTILKYDQVVHAFGFAVATLVISELLAPYSKEKGKMFYFVSALAGMGLGAINEIVEFVAVLVFPKTGVGGYYNTALDLVFNALGAGTMAVILWFLNNKKKQVSESF